MGEVWPIEDPCVLSGVPAVAVDDVLALIDAEKALLPKKSGLAARLALDAVRAALTEETTT